MAQVLIRGVEPDVIERLRARAERNGRSLEAELRIALTQAAQDDWAAARADAARIRARHGGRQFSDSVDLIREDRER